MVNKNKITKKLLNSLNETLTKSRLMIKLIYHVYCKITVRENAITSTTVETVKKSPHLIRKG